MLVRLAGASATARLKLDGRERSLEGRDREWRGSPLDLAEGMDPYGICEIVIEFDDGDQDTFTPRMREEFGSYDLHMMGAYLDSIAHSVRQNQRD
jgi:hypothetical protein